MNIFQVELNNINHNCGICQMPLLDETNQPLHTLKECKHTYHTDCIIAWFRTRNNRCPLCGNSGLNHYQEICGTFGTATESIPPGCVIHRSRFKNSQHKERYSILKQFSKEDHAPKLLKRYMDKTEKINEELKAFKKELRDFYNYKHNNVSHKELNLKHRLLQTKIRKKQHDLNNNKLNILNLPIIPVIIPQYVNLE